MRQKVAYPQEQQQNPTRLAEDEENPVKKMKIQKISLDLLKTIYFISLDNHPGKDY